MKRFLSLFMSVLMVFSCFAGSITTAHAAVYAPIPGDINGDGNVNTKDLTRLLKFVSGEDVEVVAITLDTNGDGNVNTKDLSRLMGYLSGDPNKPLPDIGCSHEMTATPASEATCTAEGNIAYWYCSKCEKYFSDAEGAREITLEETVVEPTGHNYVTVEGSGYPATVENPGKHDDKKCENCGDIIVGDVIPVSEYAILFDPYNGDTYLQSIGVENSNPTSYSSENGLALRNLSVAGYRFLGWYDLPSGTSAKNIKTIPAGTAGTIELYAHWEKIEYSIQFDSDLVDVDEIKYTTDKNTTLPKPTLDGYIFVGWSDDEGDVYKNIPTGTTGNKLYTANWLSERNKAWTKKTLADPIIVEDEKTETILFTYEIGRIENVPLYTIEDFGYINSEGVTRTISKEYTVKTEKTLMDQYSQNVANATTNSSQWSLSSGWSDSVTVNEDYLIEQGFSETDAKTICATDSENWLISNGSHGSTTTTTYESSQDYDLTTETENKKTYDIKDKTDTKTHKQSAELDISLKKSISANVDIKAVEVGMESELGINAGVGYEQLNEHTTATKTGTESDDGENNQTGSIKHTGTDTVSVGGWNKSSSYGGSKTVSEEESISSTISEKIAAEYGYGKSYIQTGDETNSQGLSSTTSTSESYSSAVTYSTEETFKESITYTTNNTKTGYHRLVKAGTAHVFAVVGYDIKSASYFVSTYTVMDDEMHNFEDYSYSSAAYDDNQTGVISFEIPYTVEEYVLSKAGETEGLEISSSGIVTGYYGTESMVCIPEYHVINNLDGSRRAVKVIGISSNAFRGNNAVTGIELSDFITEIPANAFNGCSNLSLVIMSGVTTIREGAFLSCPQINYISLSDRIVTLEDNVFNEMDTIIVCAANIDVIAGALSCVSENVAILVSDKCSGLSNTTLEIPDAIGCFIFNGYGQTFNDFYIDSDAQKTVINRVNFVSSGKTPLIMSSSEVMLNQSTVISNGICLALSADSCHLGLYGESYLSSVKGNAILCKVIDIYQIKNDLTTLLHVDGNVLVYDEGVSYLPGKAPEESSYLDVTNGQIKHISIDEYNRYLTGVIDISFDANEGYVSEKVRTANYGSAIGALPIPTRDYYKFEGWYTDKENGEKVTEDTIVLDYNDITLYAHWSRITYKVTFNANGGTVNTTSKAVELGGTYGALPVPTRTDCTFEGWYTTSGTKVTETTVVDLTGDVTLKAHWSSDWVLASSLPSDGTVVSEKWTYDKTTNITSSSKSVAGYTLYNTTSAWGSYGSWSSWSKTKATASDSRQVETKNVVDQAAYTEYHYYIYRSSDHKTFGTKGYAGVCYERDDIYLKSALGYSDKSLGLYGPYKAGCHSWCTNWFLEGTKDVPAVTHTEYRYRDRSLVYTYYHTKTESFESAKEITAADAGTNETIKNIKKWVKYTVH